MTPAALFPQFAFVPQVLDPPQINDCKKFVTSVCSLDITSQLLLIANHYLGI
jgi:hypothetical protein